jgi:1,4-alpha-glucan branching enzyme
MGTETYSKTPWYFFTSHQDEATKNNTSAYYQKGDRKPVLKGGRFLEFRPEAEDLGLKEALAFSKDGTLAGIDWQAFRDQKDAFGKPYMDHAKEETFLASKLNWDVDNDQRKYIEALFKAALAARADERIKEPDPRYTQYKGWDESERVFVFRRKDREGREFVALFNLASNAVDFHISAEGIDTHGIGRDYIVALNDEAHEEEWNGSGRYSFWLNTEAPNYGGSSALQDPKFDITDTASKDIRVAPESVIVFSKEPVATHPAPGTRA